MINKTATIGLFFIASLSFSVGLYAEIGDVNNDGNMDIIDALLIAQFYVGLNPLNFNQSMADVNGNGSIDIIDALLVAQIYVGLVSPAPSAIATPASSQAPVSYNIVVAKDGSGNYTTVQAAVNAAPNNSSTWFTIYIKDGTYREVVTVSSAKTYLHLIGQSSTGTILTYDNCNSTVGSTSGSSSAFLAANNFIAQNITFENSFDYNNSTVTNKQAVATEPQADRQIFVNCRFTGYQDTLYVRTGRQYFKSCYINGVVDFIFGDATAVFYQCEIYSRNRSGGCISAPSTLSSAAYGLVFLNCQATCDPALGSNSIWLGRPWHPSSGSGYNSSATYLNCTLGIHIKTEGWTSMSGVNPITERMKEYKNTGPGATINSTRPQLSDSEAQAYTIANILKGSDNWDPEAIIAAIK